MGDSEWKSPLASNYGCIVRTIYWTGTDFIPVATRGTAAKKKIIPLVVSQFVVIGCVLTCHLSDVLHDRSDLQRIM